MNYLSNVKPLLIRNEGMNNWRERFHSRLKEVTVRAYVVGLTKMASETAFSNEKGGKPGRHIS